MQICCLKSFPHGLSIPVQVLNVLYSYVLSSYSCKPDCDIFFLCVGVILD